jgi:hypothetical protein
MLEGLRDLRAVKARYALVMKHPEIHERELIKMAALTVAIVRSLHHRGVKEPAASLAAEAGMAAFKIGFERWVHGEMPRSFAGHITAAVKALRALTSEKPTETAKTKRAG